MFNVARICQEKHEKAKKQEIRRVHNSNPLQRHEHTVSVDITLAQLN